LAFEVFLAVDGVDVDCHGDEVFLDDADVLAPGELNTNSRCRPSGDTARRSATAPDEERFPFGRRLPPRFPQVRHPGDVFKAARIGFDLRSQLLEPVRRDRLRLGAHSGRCPRTRGQDGEGKPTLAHHAESPWVIKATVWRTANRRQSSRAGAGLARA